MILRACTVCGALSEEARCPDHRFRRWASSTRRESTLSGWEQQRRAQAVLRMHDGMCHICGNPGATIADHVIPLAEGGADTMDNLRPAHADCHATKSADEAARGRARQRRPGRRDARRCP